MRIHTIITLACCLYIPTPATAENPVLHWEESSDGILVTESGSKVLYYQRAALSKDGKFARANYVHPLFGLDGSILTEDFPADHPHHRGVFWAWQQEYAEQP